MLIVVKSGGGKMAYIYLIICFLMFICQRYGNSNFTLWINSFLSIPSIILTVILFVYIKGLTIKEDGIVYNLIKHISFLSFGIYLSHMMIYSCITAKLYNFSTSWMSQVLVFVLTFLGAWLLSYLFSKLPYSKYVIGI